MLGVLSNFPIAYMSFGMSLLSASADGKLTFDEILECLGDSALGSSTDEIIEAIRNASADGNITVLEVLNITSTILAEISR